MSNIDVITENLTQINCRGRLGNIYENISEALLPEYEIEKYFSMSFFRNPIFCLSDFTLLVFVVI